MDMGQIMKGSEYWILLWMQAEGTERVLVGEQFGQICLFRELIWKVLWMLYWVGGDALVVVHMRNDGGQRCDVRNEGMYGDWKTLIK